MSESAGKVFFHGLSRHPESKHNKDWWKKIWHKRENVVRQPISLPKQVSPASTTSWSGSSDTVQVDASPSILHRSIVDTKYHIYCDREMWDVEVTDECDPWIVCWQATSSRYWFLHRLDDDKARGEASRLVEFMKEQLHLLARCEIFYLSETASDRGAYYLGNFCDSRSYSFMFGPKHNDISRIWTDKFVAADGAAYFSSRNIRPFIYYLYFQSPRSNKCVDNDVYYSYISTYVHSFLGKKEDLA